VDVVKGSIVLGRIRGIEIELNASWFVIFGLVTFTLANSFFPQNYPEWSGVTRWVLGGGMAIMLFVSVLLHELSHSLVSIGLGIDVKKISLFIFGGVAQIEKEPDEPIKELKIAIAGPLMSLAIAITSLVAVILLGSFGAPEIVTVPLVYISNVNFVLAIFNMVPAFPLDGGRVLRAIIWKTKGSLETATRIASAAGGAFGYMLIFLGVFWVLTGNIINGIWFAFIGWFINQASQSSYQNMIMSDMFGKIKVKQFMSDGVITVDYNVSVQDMVDRYIYKYKYSSFPVKKGEAVIGVINIDRVRDTDKDMWTITTVEQISEKLKEELVVSPEDTVSTAMGKLFSNGIGRVLVMDGEKLVGIVSRTDILNHIRIYNQLH
jgi:Zn-dependent protease/CBS domain-containing protein